LFLNLAVHYFVIIEFVVNGRRTGSLFIHGHLALAPYRINQVLRPLFYVVFLRMIIFAVPFDVLDILVL
jgi:hypothetical protein